MLNFTSRTKYYISSCPVDMRKGRDGLAVIVRTSFGHDPRAYDEAFIFYSKRYDTVKILHYDLNGYVVYQKWFDDGKLLKPQFAEIKSCHKITREQVILLTSHAVQSKMYIYDYEPEESRDSFRMGGSKEVSGPLGAGFVGNGVV